MTTTYFRIQPEVLEVLEDGTCEECYRMGKMYAAIIFTNDMMPGEVRYLCTRCISPKF